MIRQPEMHGVPSKLPVFCKEMRQESGSDELETDQVSAILQGVFDAVIATDPWGNVLCTNEAARSLYGFDRHAAGESNDVNVQRYARENFELTDLEGRSVPEEDQPFMRALRGEPYRDETLCVWHKESGVEKVFEFSGTVVDGEPPLNVLTIRDVTEQHKAQRRYKISFDTNPAPALIARIAGQQIIDVDEGFS